MSYKYKIIDHYDVLVYGTNSKTITQAIEYINTNEQTQKDIKDTFGEHYKVVLAKLEQLVARKTEQVLIDMLAKDNPEYFY
jgi:hypothetical protein